MTDNASSESRCRLCGGPSTFIAQYDLKTLPGYWRTVAFETTVEIRRCKTHGSYFTANPPSSEDLIAAYASTDLAAYYSSEETDPTQKARRTVSAVQQFLTPPPPSAHTPNNTNNNGAERVTLIDVGGGNGAFAIEAARQGYESWLQEVGKVPPRNLEDAGVRWVADFSPEMDGQFDAVTLWDVFEHVWPHKEFLARLRQLLKPGGKIFIEIPSPSNMILLFRLMGRMRSPRRERALGHIVNFTHLQLMTAREIAATMPAHGFRVLHVERSSEFSYRGYEYVHRFIPISLVSRPLGWLLDRRWFRRLVIGCNKTLIVAEKPA